FEMFDGTTGPGTPLGVGIDIVNAQGPMIFGNKCEPNAAGLLCLQTAQVDGGMVTGNFFIGDGVTTTAASATSANTKGVVFLGNSFFSFTGQAISLTNGAQVDIGTNYLGTTTPTTVTSDTNLTGHQLGAPNYALLPPANFNAFAVNYNPIINKASAGTHTNFATMYLQKPSIGGGAGTVTNVSV